MTRRPALAAVLLAVLVAVSGCGLPLPDGVQAPGAVQPVRDEPGELRIIPPGPQPGAGPGEIVEGFLRAQLSPVDDHAVARQFLAPGTEWDDERGAFVYTDRRFVADSDDDPLTFSVRFATTARIEPTGAFLLRQEPVTASYTVARQPSGEFRLTSVPPGLHLRAQDRESSFRTEDVYFLARGVDGEPTARLVPDRVFLPKSASRAPALVGALMKEPTLSLRAAVETAVPKEAELASPVTVADGVVTVDLTAPVLALDRRERQRLAAQFTWTLLPAFSGVRLLAEGVPLEVEGAGEVHTLEDWAEYDPTGIAPGAPLYYVQGRTLRSLDGSLPPSDVTTPGGVPVDEAAVSAAGVSVGVLSSGADDVDEVRTGTLQDGVGEPVLRRRSLSSLSWGPGDQGLWLVAGGTVPSICLLPAPGAPTPSNPCGVPYERPPTAGPLTALRVSRDGARVALVFGQGAARQLYVGKVVPVRGGLRISGVEPVAPSLTNVTDVAWQSGTTLAVLAATGGQQVVLSTVVVDGSTPPVPVQRQGLQGEPVAVAAAPGRPLVVSAVFEGRPRLFRDDGRLFQLLPQPGSAPTYPG